MALQTLTTLSNLLLRDYDKPIRDQVFSKTVALTHLQKNVGVSVKNDTFYIKTRSTGHSGVYHDDGAAGADLNTGQPTYDEPSVPVAYAFGAHQLTHSTIKGINGDPAGIVNAAEDLADAVKISMRKSLNRQFYQRGGTEANNAVIATINGASTGTTITVDLDGGETAGPGLGTWFLYEGSLVDIGTDAEHGAATDDQITISTVDTSTTAILSGATTIADADHIKFRNSDNTEMNGMRSIADSDNTFQGIARGSNYWAAAYVDETI